MYETGYFFAKKNVSAYFTKHREFKIWVPKYVHYILNTEVCIISPGPVGYWEKPSGLPVYLKVRAAVW